MTGARVTATLQAGGTVLDAELAGDEHAFVDADAVAGGEGPVPALVVAASEDAAFEAAAGEAQAIAAEIDALVAPRAGAVDVIGSGVVAELVRQLAGSRLQREGPSATVVTRADPAAVVEGLERAPDLGLVVIAAALRSPVAVDVYGTIHRRGLVVVGVTPFGTSPTRGSGSRVAPPPRVVKSGQLLPEGASWYRLDAAV